MFGLPTILRMEHEEAAKKNGKFICETCGTLMKKPYRVLDVYDHPWDKGSKTIAVCSEECYDGQFHSGEFDYFTCEKCQRIINQQNPSNGWMVQYRTLDGEQICLQCYEEILYEEGISKEKYEAGSIAGMFFNDGDLEEHGFTKVAGYDDYFINNQEKVDTFCKAAIDLINEGNIVVTEYESLGIGGGEGYVTLWAKPKERIAGINQQQNSSETPIEQIEMWPEATLGKLLAVKKEYPRITFIDGEKNKGDKNDISGI